MQLWDQPSSSSAVPEPQLKGMKEIKKILLAIRAINKKKQGFEGGFITEEGIKVGRQRSEGKTRLIGRTESGTSIKALRRARGSDTELPL